MKQKRFTLTIEWDDDAAPRRFTAAMFNVSERNAGVVLVHNQYLIECVGAFASGDVAALAIHHGAASVTVKPADNGGES